MARPMCKRHPKRYAVALLPEPQGPSCWDCKDEWTKQYWASLDPEDRKEEAEEDDG